MPEPKKNPAEKLPESFNISTDLGNKVIGYLGTRPYVEVSVIIGELQAAFASQMLPAETPAEDKK